MRTTRFTRKLTAATAGAAALALVLTACASGDDGDEGGDAESPAGDETEVSIGIPAGWDEGIAVSHLWAAILEDEGYTVETEDADIGPIFTSLAGGGYDLLFDGWLPLTHADYIDRFGDDISDLGVWYEGAELTIAVNEDSPAQSLEDLAGMADEYGNRLVGIDAGAGLTQVTEDAVIPTYGLEDMEFVISSTPAMLAELKSATESGNNIAVTLWRPHWAYDEYPVRDLEDPEGTLGDAESIHTFGTADFAERYPTLATWIGAFTMTDEQLFSLENMMFNSDEYSSEADAVDAWLEQNPTFVEDLKAAAEG